MKTMFNDLTDEELSKGTKGLCRTRLRGDSRPDLCGRIEDCCIVNKGQGIGEGGRAGMIREVINELKKYTVGKKNSQKTEISVLALNRLIFALEEQEPCGDVISRQAVLDTIDGWYDDKTDIEDLIVRVTYLSSAEKTGRCKDCKFFKHDSVVRVDGIYLNGAHEICNKWGGGCKTKEDGYCFMFERGTENE